MFSPILPGTSLSAWTYLKDSRDDQTATLSRDPMIAADAAAFTKKIAGMTSIEDLMSDYRTLKVALGAHGLEEDLPNRFFVKKVLEEGTQTDGAFALRLSDSRYLALAQTFEGLGLTGSGDITDSLAVPTDALAEAVEDLAGDSPMVSAMAARLEADMTLGLAAADSSTRAWQRAMRDPVLSEIIGGILGVSENLYALDVEAQARVVSEATDYAWKGESLSTSLGTLISPTNAFKVADTALGTTGLTLEAGFSYQGLADRLATIATANADDADRWTALQADTTLSDLLAGVLNVPSDYATLDAAGQTAALQAAVEDRFGTDEFTALLGQANQTELGDAVLDPDGEGLGTTFSLGAFAAAISAVRDEGPSTQETWETLTGLPTLVERFAQAWDLGEDFADKDAEDQIESLRAEAIARYGTDDAEFFSDPERLAEIAVAAFEAQVASITQDYYDQAFQAAVGDQRPELRIALSLGDELSQAVGSGGTDDGRWFRVLGSGLLREAFETALGLPDTFSQIDLDAQVKLIRQAARDEFGTDALEDFLDPEAQEDLVTQYLARAGTTDTTASSPTLSLFGTASAASILATIYSQT